MIDVYGRETSPTTPTTTFVSPLALTRVQLLTNYPASAQYLGQYARVSDLWSSVDEVLRCCYDGNTYYWRPQRTDYAVSSSQSSGAVSLIPLLTAPELFMTTGLTGNMTLTPVATNAWPGCRWRVYAPSVLGVYTMIINGLVGGGTLPLVQGGYKDVVYTAAGYRAG